MSLLGSLSVAQTIALIGAVVLLGAMGSLVALYVSQRRKYGAVSAFPGYPKHPIFGQAHHIPKDRKFAEEMVRKTLDLYGKNGLSEFWLGPFANLQLYEPELIKQVIASSSHAEKNFTYDTLTRWLGDGLLLTKGDKWRFRRHLITPTFHFEVLKSFVEVMNEQGDVFVRKLAQHSAKGEAFDVFEPITLCALDIICETAMGYRLHAQRDGKKIPYVEAVYDMSALTVRRVEEPWQMNDFIFSLLPQGRRFEKNLKILHDFTNRVIDQRQGMIDIIQGNLPPRPAFLDLLLTAKEDYNGKPLTREALQEEVDTFMFEGHDTTSASIAWTLYLIGKHPEVQARLQEEIDQVYDSTENDHLTIDDIGKLKYLEMVTKESLRIYPSVPMIGRHLTEDITIRGVTLPKGLPITIFIWALHRNPSIWPDPERFDPERWTPENSQGRHPYAYLPFSAGPRNCIGQKFAQYEEKILISKVIRHFTIETATEPAVYPFPELILRPLPGVFVKLTPRRAVPEEPKA